MVEFLSKIRHLLFYQDFIPSLDNLIVDPQHHLTPNLLSISGLKLLLWNESLSCKEFKEIITLLPTNTFSLPPNQRIMQPMLRQKTLASTILSLILNIPITYSGNLKDNVSPQAAQKILKKMNLFFKMFLQLQPVKKKISKFMLKA